jgi:hypothetical protein
MLAISSPLQQFFDLDGLPLDEGRLFFGVANQNPETSPITVYWDAAGTQPAVQPIQTLNGYPVRAGSPATIYADGDYSLTVRTRKGELVVYSRSATNVSPSLTILADLADGVTAGKGSSLVAWLRAAASSVATTLKSWLGWQEVNAFEFMTIAQIADHQSGAMTLDLSAPMQAWLNAAASAGLKARLPKGQGRINAPLVLPSGVSIEGHGVGSAIGAWGCNVFTVAAGTSHVTIEKLAAFSYTAVGVPDPRTFVALQCNGTNPSNVNYVTLRDLYLQGWADAINWRYTWNSRVENCTTINTNNGLVLFGQSVNNSVDGCRLVSNGGTSSISLQNDGAIIGEGLMVTNTLMASGTYGVFVPLGFLSLHINNCVVDLVTGDGFRTTDCKDLRVSNSWVYATNCAVRLQALGASDAQGVSLVGSRFQVTSATGRCIEQNGANLGLSILGNRFTHGGTSLGIYLDGQAAVIDGNYFDNTGSGSSIFINGSPTTHRIGKNTGTVTIGGGTGVLGTPEYTEGDWTVSDQSGAGLVITNNAQARFVKNGRQVTVHMDIRYPVTANASVARLSLPFQPDTGAAPAGCLGFQDINGVFMPNASTAAANFVFWKPGASGAFATNADVSGARFVITFTYRANA